MSRHKLPDSVQGLQQAALRAALEDEDELCRPTCRAATQQSCPLFTTMSRSVLQQTGPATHVLLNVASIWRGLLCFCFGRICLSYNEMRSWSWDM